jgi:hypothetical protein
MIGDNRAQLLQKIKDCRGNLVLFAGFMLGLSCKQEEREAIFDIGGNLFDVGIEFVHNLPSEDLESLIIDLNNELNNRENAAKNLP